MKSANVLASEKLRNFRRFSNIRRRRQQSNELTLGLLVFATGSSVDVNSASIASGTVGSASTVDGCNASWQGFGTSDEADDVVWSGIAIEFWNEKGSARGDVRIGEWRSRSQVVHRGFNTHFAGDLSFVAKKVSDCEVLCQNSCGIRTTRKMTRGEKIDQNSKIFAIHVSLFGARQHIFRFYWDDTIRRKKQNEIP